MSEEKKYAEQWNVSAEYYYDKGYYSWMADKLSAYKTVLEIGCGTGYSTLALAEKGYKVISVDKNLECINQAKQLFDTKGYSQENVVFYHGDIATPETRNDLAENYDFDIVTCWNPGTYWSRAMMEFYLPHMIEYGLTPEQIMASPESSYTELILWNACRLASVKKTAVHIIDRSPITIDDNTKRYYELLKDEFNFSKALFDSLLADTISKGGRILSIKGVPHFQNIMTIYFLSILYK